MTAVGDRFGNYVIDRELGCGGMGVVYAAHHAILGHHVALKILHAEWGQREDVVQRFFNEARAAAAIDHPGIVRVHDVGIAEGAAFLVMDLLAGESLAHRLRTHGPLAIAVAVACAREIAVALVAAHAAHIVHRDLKPDNIFLVDDPRAPHGTRVVLLDFGVAKLTGSLQSNDLKTKTGALLGTPHYMSPEQCDGEREIDQRSDLYSLGCMVFQMISGKLPFEGGIGAVIGAHLHVPAPALRDAVPTAPVEIEAIISRLMAKDPSARFQTAAELVAALDAWSPSASDHAAPPMKKLDISVAATLPIPRTSESTIDSIAPPPTDRGERIAPARPSIKPHDQDDPSARAAWPASKHDTVHHEPAETAPPMPDVVRRDAVPSSRRGVLVAGAAFGLVGLGVMAFALTREQGGGEPRSDASVAHAPDAARAARRALDAARVDAAIAITALDATAMTEELDADIGATRVDDAMVVALVDAASGRGAARDAAQLDAPLVEAEDVARSTTDAGGARELLIQKRIASIVNAEWDFDVSREFMILEIEAPSDPRLPRVREDARKVIGKVARDEDRKAIHLALVGHDWATGLAKCRAWGDVLRVDIVVQCTVFACIGKDDAKLETWAGGIPSRSMLEYIEQFCQRHRKR